MPTDRQLRQRAEEVRQQLKMTMSQTTAAIITSMQLSQDNAQRRHGESPPRCAQTAAPPRISRRS